MRPDGRPTFDLVAGGGRERVTLTVAGEHMVSNALAAAAVGMDLGVPIEACADALARAAVSCWRMETFETPDGVLVLNDAYNANIATALQAVRAHIRRGDLVLVKGSRVAGLETLAEALR